ncbi:MAG: 2-isopropylmalate synthase [Candidatus Limiplasma sp.]|nr:2-isopropylmalate synthase [Candidatus Limiplasma sp.]
MKQVKIFDTTLRDGEQAPGCSMDLAEKIEIAQGLERMKVDVIEAGFAIASQGDFEAVQTVARMLKNCTVASLSRATQKDIDAAWNAVKEAKSPLIHTFLATSPTHMQYKLKMSEQEVLEAISSMVAYARNLCPQVEFSAEDATRSDPAFLAKAVDAAIRAGACIINIPDTVGYAMPTEMAELMKYLQKNVENIDSVTLSVHCHNDLGLGVANSLAAVGAGATQVECTINGIGERAGNAALEELVMAMHTRKDLYPFECGVDTTRISPMSRLVYNILGVNAPMNKAVVGQNAFAHEAGIHQHGVMANRSTYEIMTPESIGLMQNRMVLGKHSGRHAVEERLNALGYQLGKEELDQLFARFKDLCDRKKVISDYDLDALAVHRLSDTGAGTGYRLERFTVNSGNYVTSNAVVSVLHDGERTEEVALGDGPIDAAFNAVDKLIPAPPHSLEDYVIQTISEGKDAPGEAMVKIRCGEKGVTGRGLSTDVVEASILAYINGMNKL